MTRPDGSARSTRKFALALDALRAGSVSPALRSAGLDLDGVETNAATFRKLTGHRIVCGSAGHHAPTGSAREGVWTAGSEHREEKGARRVHAPADERSLGGAQVGREEERTGGVKGLWVSTGEAAVGSVSDASRGAPSILVRCARRRAVHEAVQARRVTRPHGLKERDRDARSLRGAPPLTLPREGHQLEGDERVGDIFGASPRHGKTIVGVVPSVPDAWVSAHAGPQKVDGVTWPIEERCGTAGFAEDLTRHRDERAGVVDGDGVVAGCRIPPVRAVRDAGEMCIPALHEGRTEVPYTRRFGMSCFDEHPRDLRDA